jgi:hypothetical protein
MTRYVTLDLPYLLRSFPNTWLQRAVMVSGDSLQHLRSPHKMTSRSPFVMDLPSLKSRNNRSKACSYTSGSVQLVKSPMLQARRSFAAHVWVVCITLSSSCTGTSISRCSRLSCSKAASTSSSIQALLSAFTESSSRSFAPIFISWARTSNAHPEPASQHGDVERVVCLDGRRRESRNGRQPMKRHRVALAACPGPACRLAWC